MATSRAAASKPGMRAGRTLTRRRTAAAATIAMIVAAALAVALAGGSSPSSHAKRTGASTAAGTGAAFLALAPRRPPARWTSATIASGDATLAYPRSWQPIPGDSGTVSAALRDSSGRYLGYVNVTPRQGAERLRGWAAFRLHRNGEEGDTHVVELWAAERTFDGARGSCVIDDYLSRVGSNPYRELACLIAGRHATVVFIGATLVSAWTTLGPVVERAALALRPR